MTNQPKPGSREERFHIAIEHHEYEGWWWRVENEQDQLVNFIGSTRIDLKEPDGNVLRGRAHTRRGAIRKAKRKLYALNLHFKREADRRQTEGRVERIEAAS